MGFFSTGFREKRPDHPVGIPWFARFPNVYYSAPDSREGVKRLNYGGHAGSGLNVIISLANTNAVCT